eukprot:scaffold136244_cov21-Tisochrysis_lutea.AAC.1
MPPPPLGNSAPSASPMPPLPPSPAYGYTPSAQGVQQADYGGMGPAAAHEWESTPALLPGAFSVLGPCLPHLQRQFVKQGHAA